jgi:hypothetical protein
MHRKPYDPATLGPQALVHDRRAREINRGSAAHVVGVEVDDPFERGARIAAVRSVRDDPLGDRHSRGHIDQAQFEAGRQFQRCFQIAERGPKAVQFSEAVDGNPPREMLTDRQLAAWKWLAKCYRRLGADGSALVNDVLIHARTTKQVAASRGMAGQEWEKYYSRRLGECLNTLALVARFSQIEGYKCLSLTRALDVVKCQLALV